MCFIDECESSPCRNGGVCLDRTNAFLCECLAGHTGTVCESELNECDSSPCLNGGTCEDFVGAFGCRCQPGWRGKKLTHSLYNQFFYIFYIGCSQCISFLYQTNLIFVN